MRMLKLRGRPGAVCLTAMSLAACATANGERTVHALFKCDDGRKLNVVFNITRETALVRVDKKTTVELPSQHPPAGMRYAGQGYELHGAGDIVEFIGPQQPSVTCRQAH